VAAPDRPSEGHFRTSLVRYGHAIGRAYATRFWIRSPEGRRNELISRKAELPVGCYVSHTSMMSVW